MEVEHISGLQRPVINLRLDLTGLTSPEQVYEKLVAGVRGALWRI